VPVRKVLLTLAEDGDVKGRVLSNRPRLDPLVKWLLIVSGLILVFVLALLVQPRVPLDIGLKRTPTPTPTPPPLQVIGPLAGSTVGLVQPVPLRVVGHVDAAITRLALRVNGVETEATIPTPIGPVEVTATGASRNRAVTTLTHLFEWQPQGPGRAVVEVVLHSLDGAIISTPPMTYYVADDRGPIGIVAQQLGRRRMPITLAPDRAPAWSSPPQPMPRPTAAPDVATGF